MLIFKRIKFRRQRKTIKQSRIFNIPYLETCKDKNTGKRTYRILLFCKKDSLVENLNNQMPLFYLKVNRDCYDTFLCLQHWVNIIDELGADFIIICDRTRLERRIYRFVEFKNPNVKFMKSKRRGWVKNFVENTLDKGWAKTAFAHLTTFCHAKSNNIQNFWNIDADDTMFIADPKTSAEILKTAQKYAEFNKLDAFSFDMWGSRTAKVYWSFGITYTRMTTDWLKLFRENKNFDWNKKYEYYIDINNKWNLDGFITYLRDTHCVNVGYFYCDDLLFIHWGDFLRYPIVSDFLRFKNGRVIYLLLNYVYECPETANIPIADGIVKLDLVIDSKLCRNFALSFFKLRSLGEKNERRWQIKILEQ